MWHIAVQGGLADSPIAWIVGLRGLDKKDIVTCITSKGQHPQALRGKPVAAG